MTLSDLERLAREAIASKGKWRMDILLTEEELALWEAANPDTVLALLRVVRAAVDMHEEDKILAMMSGGGLHVPDKDLYAKVGALYDAVDALATLNLKDET